jgi:hypothetical protein
MQALLPFRSFKGGKEAQLWVEGRHETSWPCVKYLFHCVGEKYEGEEGGILRSQHSNHSLEGTKEASFGYRALHDDVRGSMEPLQLLYQIKCFLFHNEDPKLKWIAYTHNDWETALEDAASLIPGIQEGKASRNIMKV